MPAKLFGSFSTDYGYRRTFAWRHAFSSRVTDRQGPGAKVPQPGEGQAWLLGNNAERGNVLFRRGRLDVSAGVRTGFSLCNAWVDVHNSLTGRTEPAAVERVSYAVDIFPGSVPGIDVLNRYLTRDGGAGRTLVPSRGGRHLSGVVAVGVSKYYRKRSSISSA